MSNAWQKDFQELKAVLVAATRVRHLHRDVVDGESGWVVHERSVMHDATNRIRSRYGLCPATGEQILSVENRACGHIDYVQKYAIGCTDLVHEQSEHAR